MLAHRNAIANIPFLVTRSLVNRLLVGGHIAVFALTGGVNLHATNSK